MAEEWMHLQCPTVMKPQRLDIGPHTHNIQIKHQAVDCKTEL